MFGIREALNYPLINDMGFIIPRIYPTFKNKKYWVMIVYNRERGGATFYSVTSEIQRCRIYSYYYEGKIQTEIQRTLQHTKVHWIKSYDAYRLTQHRRLVLLFCVILTDHIWLPRISGPIYTCRQVPNIPDILPVLDRQEDPVLR